MSSRALTCQGVHRAGPCRADNVPRMVARLIPSEFRVEKQRANAVLTLSSGQSARGCFFTAGGSARHAGPERVGDLLNSDTGFFPFEVHDDDGSRTVLFNRSHVVMVVLGDNEAKI